MAPSITFVCGVSVTEQHAMVEVRDRATYCCGYVTRADELGGLPERAVGAAAVPLARLADRERLGELQQPAADRLLPHRLHRGSARGDHGRAHVGPLAEEREDAEPHLPGGVGAGRALPGDALLRGVHHRARRARVRDRSLRNLNHMYASQDVVNWTGFWIFVASLVVIAAVWVAARPLVLAPIARLFGKVSGR